MTPIVASCSDIISICWFVVYAFNLLICFHDWEIFQQNIILFNSSCNALRWNIYTVLTLTVIIRNLKKSDICILLLKWGTGLRGRNQSKKLSGTFLYIHLKISLLILLASSSRAPAPAEVRAVSVFSCKPPTFLPVIRSEHMRSLYIITHST